MKSKPQIFASYSWKDKDIVDQIDKDFQTVGITLIRDVRDLKYKDSIKQYMKRIRESDFVLMIISNNFLESHNCLFEVLEFVKDESYKNRILPIILPETNLTPEGKSFYTNYWNYRNRIKKNISMRSGILFLIDGFCGGDLYSDTCPVSSVQCPVTRSA